MNFMENHTTMFEVEADKNKEIKQLIKILLFIILEIQIVFLL